MSIETGFRNFGFVDDREEQEKWGKIEEKLTSASEPAPKAIPAVNTDIEAKYDLQDEAPDKEWQVDMKQQMKRANKTSAPHSGFFQRNKRQIFDAFIVLGVIYVGYKLFFEKDSSVEMMDSGGETAYTPPPVQSVPPPAPVAPVQPVDVNSAPPV